MGERPQNEIDDEMILDDEEDDLDECALRPDGQCGMAGSEWCDWECPMRNSEFFAGSDAWRKNHSRKS